MSSPKKRRCRRCKGDYEASDPKQRICGDCRTKCSSCGTFLTKETWDTRGYENRKQFRCKSCVAEEVRNTPNRKEWQKTYDLKRHYGISPEEYEEMAKDGCQICGTVEGRLVVDHCHASGDVRGVLCSNCNTGLGMFQDQPKLMEAALGYLKRT